MMNSPILLSEPSKKINQNIIQKPVDKTGWPALFLPKADGINKESSTTGENIAKVRSTM